MQGSASHQAWSFLELPGRRFLTAQHRMTLSHLSRMVSMPDVPSEG
jgi:hypothetical protein